MNIQLQLTGRMLLAGILLSVASFSAGYFIASPRGSSYSDPKTLRYCQQVYYGDIPPWLQPFVPPSYLNGTYRVYVCKVN